MGRWKFTLIQINLDRSIYETLMNPKWMSDQFLGL